MTVTQLSQYATYPQHETHAFLLQLQLKYKLTVSLLNNHSIIEHDTVKAELHTFQNSALDGGT